MKNLKELRETKKISQKTLADKIGISQSNICEYEKGTIEATESVIIKLAKFFDVKVGYLLGTEEYDGTEIEQQLPQQQVQSDSPNFNISTQNHTGNVNIKYK